ncbi:restriction endonuclease subunit S [Tatumella terrea]|uniref:Restriction endonuclease subunit S n=1 Tax=Tatumella terrea TaxID=419007 RepID=A0ABW1VTU1_9GAMM
MTTDNLPKKWIKTKLGTLIELKYGKSLAAHSRDGIGFDVFGSNGVVGKHSTALVNTHGLIVGRKGSHGVVNKSIAPFFPIDTTYYVDEFHQQPINFWFYYLTLLPLTRLNRSTAIPGLNRDDAYDLDIMLPSINEQKIIADKLDDLLARVENIKTRLENIPEILKKFRQSVLSAAVSGELTEEWRKENESPFDLWKSGILNDFIQKPSYGSSSKSQSEGEIPVLRMGNLQRGEIDWTDLVYTSDPKEIEKYTLASGDVLFNRTNSPELVGKTSIYRGERNAIYAGYLIRVKVKDSLNSDFLNYHLNSPQAKEYCLSVKSDGVSQSNINAKKLSEYPIAVPPYSEQLEIVNKLESFFHYIDNLEKKSTNAILYINSLSQSILAKAFRGELTAQWREENPDLISGINSAEALLEKITAEKLATGTVKKRAKKSIH